MDWSARLYHADGTYSARVLAPANQTSSVGTSGVSFNLFSWNSLFRVSSTEDDWSLLLLLKQRIVAPDDGVVVARKVGGEASSDLVPAISQSAVMTLGFNRFISRLVDEVRSMIRSKTATSEEWMAGFEIFETCTETPHHTAMVGRMMNRMISES